MVITDQDVGRNIRDLRVDRQITQADLARRLYLDRTAVSRVERGQRAVTTPELTAFARALDVDIKSLVSQTSLRASQSHAAQGRPRPIEPRQRWLQIRIPGCHTDFLFGLGLGRVPAVTLVNTSEAPVTAVGAFPIG